MMIDNPDVPLPVIYSTPRDGAVADYVAARYAMPGPLECWLVRRGFNDSFEVRSQDGQRWVLRLSNLRARGEADVASETAFLAHLEQSGIPVAAPTPAKDGTLFGTAWLPEGQRPAVLFRYAEGRTPLWESAADACASGVTLARIHRAAPDYAGGNAGRYRPDLDQLLHRPLAALLGLSRRRRRYGRFCATGGAVVGCGRGPGQPDLDALPRRLRFNRILEEGPDAGQAMFFDFDDGGPGYLAYDLAVFLWARVSLQRSGHDMAQVHRRMSIDPTHRAADFEAVDLFVPIRHIWLLGE